MIYFSFLKHSIIPKRLSLRFFLIKPEDFAHGKLAKWLEACG
jgi:hypothetical protein